MIELQIGAERVVFLYYTHCQSLHSSRMNQTVRNQTSLEDFEEFDLRDAINVVVYGFMSLGELDTFAEVLLATTNDCLISWDGTEWTRPGDCCQTVCKVLANTF